MGKSPLPHESSRALRARYSEYKRKYSDPSNRPPQQEVDQDYRDYRKIQWELNVRGEKVPNIVKLHHWGYREKYDSIPKNRQRNRIRKRHRYKAEKLGMVKKGDGKELDHTCGQKRKKGMKPCPLHWRTVKVRESQCAHRKAEGASCVKAYPEDDDGAELMILGGIATVVGLCVLFRDFRQAR